MSNLPPDSTGPEYLEHGHGDPLGPTSRHRPGRRTALVGGGVVGLLAVGGGVWAAMSFLATGAQPAEGLPASTLGYVSIDLDPSGGQKIEALRTLRKFPAIKEQINLGTDDDVRRWVFEQVQDDGFCADLDYADDIEPWLGNRAALAAVDTGGDLPSAVVVLQVTDADAAEEGLGRLKDCSSLSGSDVDSGEGSGEESGQGAGGFVVEGDWAVLAQDEGIARDVVDEAAEASLADDTDYREWTGRTGDAGIISMYLAPEAGAQLGKVLDGMHPLAGLSSEGDAGTSGQASEALRDFGGMAATVRFADGALEIEAAGDPGPDQASLYATDRGDDVLATLPADTAAALGMGFEPGWFEAMVDQMVAMSGDGATSAELLEELSAETGLDLPEDAETLLGESAALAMGSDFDLEEIFNSADGSGLPVAAKVKGDPDGIEEVLAKVRRSLGSDAGGFLDADSSGDLIAVGPDDDYRSEVLRGGDLGDSAVFGDVVPRAEDASGILFLNFDAGDWLVALADGDEEAAENLAPLSGFGASSWQEDDAVHGLLKVTTD